MTWRLVLASRNRGKAAEISRLLAPHGLQVIPVTEYPDTAEVVEDGSSFAENAAKKATETAQQTGLWAIGEDSGLCVDALDGAPGIYSARYAGEQATDEDNNRKLLQALQSIPPEHRQARYVCSVVLSDPNGSVRITAEGTCQGRIVTAPRGTGGFGYDPLFLIPEYHRTFGELSPLVKEQLSHRGRAFFRLLPDLLSLAGEFPAGTD